MLVSPAKSALRKLAGPKWRILELTIDEAPVIVVQEGMNSPADLRGKTISPGHLMSDYEHLLE